MFLTEKDKIEIAKASALTHLRIAREDAKVAGMGWEIDDMFGQIIEGLEFEE